MSKLLYNQAAGSTIIQNYSSRGREPPGYGLDFLSCYGLGGVL